MNTHLELKRLEQVILTKTGAGATLHTICRRVDETGSAVTRLAVELLVAAAGELLNTLFEY